MDGIITEKIPINRFQSKEVTFHFGMWVWVGIAQKYEMEIDNLDKLDTSKVVSEALFFAANWPRMLKGEKPYPEEKVKAWVELIPGVQLNRIVKCMMDSRVGGKTIMEFTQDAAKKKQRQKR